MFKKTWLNQFGTMFFSEVLLFTSDKTIHTNPRRSFKKSCGTLRRSPLGDLHCESVDTGKTGVWVSGVSTGCQNDVMMVSVPWKEAYVSFSSENEQEEGKERRLEGRSSGGGREEEVNEQYMSVERTEGGEGGGKKERRGFRFDVGVFLTAIILQPTEFHQHKLC